MTSRAAAESCGRDVRDDHICWVFDEREHFTAAATTFLGEGLALGQHVLYAGDSTDASMRRDVNGLGDVDGLVSRGAVRLVSIEQTYPQGGWTPAGQAALYTAATEAALAGGFTGFRVAADATSLAVGDEALDVFVRYEHHIDRLMAGGLEFQAMCGYDRRAVGDEAVLDLACVHPATSGADNPFAVFGDGDAAFALAGEVDSFCIDAFTRVLRRVLPSHPTPANARLEIDCSSLEFIDHRGLLTLDSTACERGVAVCLLSAPPVVARLAGLVRLQSIRLGPG